MVYHTAIDKVPVRTLGDDTAVFEDEDLIGIDYAADALGDDECGTRLHDCF